MPETITPYYQLAKRIRANKNGQIGLPSLNNLLKSNPAPDRKLIDDAWHKKLTSLLILLIARGNT